MATLPKPEARKLRRVNRQTMIALPTWVRRRLGARPGVTLYWHGHRKGEVVLTAHEARPRGQAGRADLENELREVTAERDSLRQSLSGHDLAERREVYAAGAMQGIRAVGPLSAQLDYLVREVAKLTELVSHLPGARIGRRRHRATSQAPAVESVRLYGENPPLPPTLLAEFPGGDVASGGGPPQATHE